MFYALLLDYFLDCVEYIHVCTLILTATLYKIIFKLLPTDFYGLVLNRVSATAILLRLVTIAIVFYYILTAMLTARPIK